MNPPLDISIDELVTNFELLGDWEDRYGYLIELGRKLPPMAEADKTEENIVKGCQATVWLKESIEDGDPIRLRFNADSNSSIVKGLVAILLLVFSGKTPTEILQTDPATLLSKLALENHLSPTRKNGLHAMTQQIKVRAQNAL